MDKVGEATQLYLMSPHRTFPNLLITRYQLHSPRDPYYNCIAWAAGERHRAWWPNPYGFWPEDVVREETVESFLSAFATLGYQPCNSVEVETNFEKVALYCKEDKPKHMARQLEDGTWTSKLGVRGVDIIHPTLEGVEGDRYGFVKIILKRPKLRAE